MVLTSSTYRATLTFTGAAVPSGAAVVFAGINVGGISPLAIATLVETAWDTCDIESIQTDDITMTQVMVKVGPDEDGPSAVVPGNVQGALVVSSAPPNTAYLVHKSTALGGRRGRGRMFIPGVPEQYVTDSGTIDPAVVAAAPTILNALLNNLDINGVPMALEHEPATEWVLVNGQPRRVPVSSSAPVPDEVTGLTLDATAATQRRRLRR